MSAPTRHPDDDIDWFLARDDAPEPPEDRCGACGDVVGDTACECHAPAEP